MPLPRPGVLLGQPLNRSHPLNRGRIAWWLTQPGRASGARWRDLCGKYDGTLVTGPAWRAASRIGGWGSLSFAGPNAYVDCGPIILPTAFTLSAWINPQVAAGTSPALFGGTSLGSPELRILETGELQLVSTYQYIMATSSSGAVASGVWQKVDMTYDGSNVAFYVNRAPVGGAAYASGFNYGNLTLAINGYGYANNVPEQYTGLMDDVSLLGFAASPDWIGRAYMASLQGYPGVLNRARVAYWAAPAAPALGWLPTARTLSGLPFGGSIS